MIFFTEQLIKDKQELINSLQKEINLNNIFIHYQRFKENLLSNTIKMISSPSYLVNPEDKDALESVLESYKSSLSLSKNNIRSIEDLSALFESIKQMNDEDILKKIEEFNTKVFETDDVLLKNNEEILHTLELDLPKNISCEVILKSEIEDIDNISDSMDSTSKDSATNLESNSESTTNVDSASNIVIDSNTKVNPTSSTLENKVKEIKDNAKPESNCSTPKNFKENTLVISEKTKKVFLPYNLNCVEDLLKNNPNKYSNLENVIEKEFTLPLEQFKSPSISRFREAFKLVRNKENGSFKESIDLAMELFFNYNLHPAIISACKNLDELDIYLDYLAENETEKFNCFNIEFEAMPVIVKHISKHKMN